MPKIAYSDTEREQVREALIATGLELIAKQGLKQTTVAQIYEKVGISRTFFYTFFSAKEDLVVHALYRQQPKLIQYAKDLMNDPDLSWRDGVKQFLYNFCYSSGSGFAIMNLEEQQMIFRRLSAEKYQIFREKQVKVFTDIMGVFGIRLDMSKTKLLGNLCLAMMTVRKAIPDTLPFFFPEAADEMVSFQINAIVDYMEKLYGEDTV